MTASLSAWQQSYAATGGSSVGHGFSWATIEAMGFNLIKERNTTTDIAYFFIESRKYVTKYIRVDQADSMREDHFTVPLKIRYELRLLTKSLFE